MEPETTLLPEAQLLGYQTEELMLRDMYIEKNMSLKAIAKKLGYAPYKIRKRMEACEIPVKGPGGPNHTRRLLQHLTDSELFESTVNSVAAKHGVNEQTVVFERRRRRRIASAIQLGTDLQRMLEDAAREEQ